MSTGAGMALGYGEPRGVRGVSGQPVVENAPLNTRFAQAAEGLALCHGLLDEIEQRVEPTPEKLSGGGPVAAVQGLAGHAMHIAGQVQYLHTRLAKLRDAL